MTSRIVIGTPRIPAKPPRRFPCAHPRTTGTNIFTAGGFESAFGLGPGGNEIPGIADVGGLTFPFLNWSDFTPAPLAPQAFFQEDISGTATAWTVSTTNPRTGTYHARQSMVNETTRNRLYISKFPVCPLQSTWYQANDTLQYWQPGAAAVVEAGDVWDLTFWAMASAVTNSNKLELHVQYTNFDDTARNNSFPLLPINQALTTSYAEFTASQVVPGDLGYDPHIMIMWIENSWVTNSGTVTIDIDDINLDLL